MTEVRCEVCETPGCGRWFDLERGVIARCPNPACGVGFLVDQPDDDRLVALYGEFYYPEHGGTGVFENSTGSRGEQHFAALERRLGLVGRRVLDYGCGIGNFLEVGERHGADVVGLELDDQGRRTAQERGFEVVKNIDELTAKSFDVVYMNDVIEHLRNPVAELQRLRDVLRPGGALFVATMNMRGIKPRMLGARWDVITNPTHLWFFDERSLRFVLQRAGFERSEVQRWPVEFDHHGPPRRVMQRVLQQFALDGALRVLTYRPR